MTDPTNAFKDTEIGPIPEDWQLVRLGDPSLFSFANGLWKGKRSPLRSAKVLRNTNFNNDGTLDYSDVAELEVQVSQFESRQLQQGDIILERSGGGPTQPVGRVVYFDRDEDDFSFSNFTTRIRVGDTSRASSKYVHYYLLHFYLMGQTEALQKRTTGIRNLHFADYKKSGIPLPPLPEQRRIAHVLSTVQSAIAAQDNVITAARELKRSLLRRLFTYGPHLEELPTKETDFGPVPEPWSIAALNDHAYVQTGVTKGRKLDGHQTITVPYLRVANVQDGYLDLSEIKRVRIKADELDRFRLQDGDVVLTEGGDFDKLGRGFIWRNQVSSCIHQNHVYAVRTNRESLLPDFLAYLAQSEYGKRYFLKVAHRTTNLASINSTKLKAFPILVPTTEEQALVASQLDLADRKIRLEEERKNAIEQLFRSLLHNLMTGRIRTDEADLAIG